MLRRNIIDQSLAAGRTFILRSQKEAGNFQCQYNIESKSYADQDSAVPGKPGPCGRQRSCI